MSEKSGIVKGLSELSKSWQTKPRRARPPVDIYENERELVIFADMPGVDPSNLDVHLDNDELKVGGTQTVNEEAGLVPLLFERSFRVPRAVNPDGVNAVLKGGVLEVRIPKTEKAGPRKIEVSAG